jgi:SpoVK/Ycf46/Vps4 family AAA+-type ATPase
MQGVLLSEWDGLKTLNSSSESQGPVVLLGATNRPHDLDSAILRRMPVQVKMNMPGLEGRLDILQKLLGHAGVHKEESAAGACVRVCVCVSCLCNCVFVSVLVSIYLSLPHPH